MRDRQDKCPGCGLANFRDAAECQWCALALSGLTYAEYVDDAPAAPDRPWGLLLLLLAALTVGGGVIQHLKQKAEARVEAAAEAAEAEARAKKRTRSPALSGRSPRDRQQFEDVISKWIKENNEKTGRHAAASRRMNELLHDLPPRDTGDRRDERDHPLRQRRDVAPPAPPAPADPHEW